MGMMKNYLLNLLALCSEEQFGQDAVEWGINTGQVPLTYNLEQDLRTIMGEPGRPDTGKYDDLCEHYRRTCRQRELEEADLPLVDELNRHAA